MVERTRVEVKILTLLNTSVLTSYGSYDYVPLTREEVCDLIVEGFASAMGHPETAEVLSELLNSPVPVNRVEYVQQPGEKAIIFKLKSRIPAGTILSRKELEEVGYEFGLLTRTQ